jgi:hypothetical protein
LSLKRSTVGAWHTVTARSAHGLLPGVQNAESYPVGT